MNRKACSYFRKLLMKRFYENKRFKCYYYRIEDYEATPLLSLDTAVKTLENVVSNVIQYAVIAKDNCIATFDELTRDESAAIQMYTMVWKPIFQSLYMQLNIALRSNDREKLLPYHFYLKLLLHALCKLKSNKTTIWRANATDLTSNYPVGKTFVWRSFR